MRDTVILVKVKNQHDTMMLCDVIKDNLIVTKDKHTKIYLYHSIDLTPYIHNLYIMIHDYYCDRFITGLNRMNRKLSSCKIYGPNNHLYQLCNYSYALKQLYIETNYASSKPKIPYKCKYAVITDEYLFP